MMSGFAFGLQLSYTFEEGIIQISIFTIEYIVAHFAEILEESGTGMVLSRQAQNNRAILDGMLVVTMGGRYGVVDSSNITGPEIIGIRHNSITYIEYTGEFFVTTGTGRVRNNG